MFASVAPVDLGRICDVESEFSAASGCSLSTWMPCRRQRTIATERIQPSFVSLQTGYENFSFAEDLVGAFQIVEDTVERLILQLPRKALPELPEWPSRTWLAIHCHSLLRT